MYKMGKTYEITFHLIGGEKIKTSWFVEYSTDVWRDQMEVKDAISDRGRFVVGSEDDDHLIVIPQTSVLYMTINEEMEEEG